MTGVAKRLVPVPPMRNLTDGRRTLREWIDLANRDGLGLVERRDALHVLGRAASLLASLSASSPLGSPYGSPRATGGGGAR